jgi:geranylgeranyl diphosphate synthase, type II
MIAMFELHAYIAARRAAVNTALEEIFAGCPESSRLLDAMKYSLTAGGKRLRPILCIASAEAVGKSIDEPILKVCCALEMIHTYSLVHDDLPGLDNDALRRGRPTCHVAFDEATAILAGDALLTMAFSILARAGAESQENASKWLEIIRCISDAAGCTGMIEGQMRDIAAEGKSISKAELASVHALKTGALIRASVFCGALLADGTRDEIAKLTRYANHLGLAFQVIDDILNVEGDPRIMGKAAGTDSARMKTTYPSLLGVKKSREFAAELVKNALHAIALFDNRSDPLRAIARYVLERKR